MKYILLVVLMIPCAFGETFKLAGEWLEFKDQDGLLLSGCQKNCDALKAISKYKKIDLRKVRKEGEFASSIGSDVCDRVYKAKSLLGTAMNRDGRAFCYFPDRSLVEINSLSSYLQQKKIVVE